jgi:hypothetical protein
MTVTNSPAPMRYMPAMWEPVDWYRAPSTYGLQGRRREGNICTSDLCAFDSRKHVVRRRLIGSQGSATCLAKVTLVCRTTMQHAAAGVCPKKYAHVWHIMQPNRLVQLVLSGAAVRQFHRLPHHAPTPIPPPQTSHSPDKASKVGQ